MVYKFGVIVSRMFKNIGFRYIGVCNCGQHIIGETKYDQNFQCEKCGNDYFVSAVNKVDEDNPTPKRFVIPYIEATTKSNRGFKFKRANLSVEYKDGGVHVIKENTVRTMEYDMVDKVLKVWKNDELEYDYSAIITNDKDSVNRRFFTGLETDAFLDCVSNEYTRELFVDIVPKLGKGQGYYNRKLNVLTGLEKLFEKDFSWLQILSSAGIPNVKRFVNTYNIHNLNNSAIDRDKTKPHEILKVPKAIIPLLKQEDNLALYELDYIQKYLSFLDVNQFKELVSIARDESSIKTLLELAENTKTMYQEHGYTNVRKLILYVLREVRLTQGLTSPSNALVYLRDYVRMSKEMNLEWERYPKSLKKEHDVVSMNYNVIIGRRYVTRGNTVNADDREKPFKEAVAKENYKSLEFENRKFKYIILTPEEHVDLVNEGNKLSHCVSSYIKDVISDKCKILFLRDKKDIAKPLVTIEVRGMNIRQAKGYSNRPVTEEQKEFIKRWAEEKNLVEAYY